MKPGRLVVPQLNLSQKRWYAQQLADRLHRGHWTGLKPPPPKEKPKFRALGDGEGAGWPAVMEVEAKPHARSGTPPARVVLGAQSYWDALDAMPHPAREAWEGWLTPFYDKVGRRIPAHAIFVSEGRFVAVAGNASKELVEAAIRLLVASSIRVDSTRAASRTPESEVIAV